MEGSRPADEGDLPRLVALFEAGTTELKAMRGGDLWLASRASGTSPETELAASLADPDQLVIAGTLHNVVVAYARARLQALCDGRVLGVVDELFVEEAAREVGLGEVLMGEILEWCQARGCSGVDATALPGHRTSKNFFEAWGFSARLLVMHRPLAER